MNKFNLNTFTLKLAIGTIWLVASFLFVCGMYNIYPFIEELSRTSTWGIFLTIPIIIFAYTLGEVVIYFNDSIFFRSSSDQKEIDYFIQIVKSENEFLIKRYENMQYQLQFFKTCIPTFIFLGFSIIWSSIRVFKNDLTFGIKEVSIVLGIFIIVFSFVFIKMASKKKIEIKYLLEKLNII